MITKRVWIKRRYYEDRFKSPTGGNFTYQAFEGWYLLGLLPLYIRARGPEVDRR